MVYDTFRLFKYCSPFVINNHIVWCSTYCTNQCIFRNFPCIYWNIPLVSFLYRAFGKLVLGNDPRLQQWSVVFDIKYISKTTACVCLLQEKAREAQGFESPHLVVFFPPDDLRWALLAWGVLLNVILSKKKISRWFTNETLSKLLLGNRCLLAPRGSELTQVPQLTPLGVCKRRRKREKKKKKVMNHACLKEFSLDLHLPNSCHF